MRTNSVNVLIAGEAGQGLVTLSQILTKGIVRAGYYIVVNQSYQSRIRGGHNSYAIRISEKEIIAPSESVDLLVALDKNSVDTHLGELSDKGLAVVDEEIFSTDHPKIVRVPFTGISSDKFSNSVALGVVTSLLGLPRDTISEVLQDFFGRHAPDAVQHNLSSFSAGYEWAHTKDLIFSGLPAPNGPGNNLTINGNEAIALGAMAAGLKFYSFYPMSPATSIATTLAEHAKDMEFVLEQAEDEISAINMAVGASFVGAPSMVATSGGGFALMTETVSLAGMTETPVVIVV
ncbi:MAG: 2-oxoacid:acceptor oxidoreductase family protein, partial [Desulfomonilaceae bacterium]